VEIEIYSDVVCPWCYLGAARLDAALATYDGDVTLRWRPFQLDPHAPRTARPLMQWLGERFGGPDRARQLTTHVAQLAEREGLHLDFDRAVIANTFDAHRLLWFADQPEAVLFGAGPDTQQELAGLLHQAHFSNGSDIGDVDVLVESAERAGLDGGRVRRLLATTEGTADVRALLARAHDLGITSVPTFVFAGRFGVSGARETSVLRQFLDDAARRGTPTPGSALVPGQRTASETGHVADGRAGTL
jgi:predicted DsbA family dithiol-disulfide isomerase